MSHHGADTRQGTEKDPEGEEERMEAFPDGELEEVEASACSWSCSE